MNVFWSPRSALEFGRAGGAGSRSTCAHGMRDERHSTTAGPLTEIRPLRRAKTRHHTKDAVDELAAPGAAAPTMASTSKSL